MEVTKPNKAQVIAELWRRGFLKYKLDPTQQELYDLFYADGGSKIQTWLLSRRCLAEGTLIKTPKGLIKIEDIKPGDEVYGVNKDQSVSICKVKQTFNNGEKEVIDLCNNGRVIETCTLNHTWLTINAYDNKLVERQTKDIKRHNKIVRKFIELNNDYGISEPHAYAIGALLGDGCSKQNTKGNTRKIYISSEDNKIPEHLSNILNCTYYKNEGGNYTWVLSTTEKLGKGSKTEQVECAYYKEWCYDKYAHEKIVDLEIIKKWNTESQLKFLAGLIDTDGSFIVTGDNCLMYSIEMQSFKVIEAIQYIIHNLFQHKATIHVNDREKFVNGPTYSIKIKNNFISKKISKVLSEYMVLDRKKWKPEYEFFLENNTHPDFMGVTKSNPRIMNTYDIHIGNETNLYLTANGLVTHNCGKSYALCVLALELCLKKPNCIVKFVAPTKLQIATIVRPLFTEILKDCPPDLRPELKKADHIYYFKNGSELQLAGTDNKHAEKLRGGDSWAAFVDEAGSCSDLEYIIKDILLPTTLITKGKIILAGTPPTVSEHDFLKYIEECSLKGALVKKTIDDNKRITQEQRDELINELGGINNESTRRELYCEIIKDPKTAVLPEFTDLLEKDIVKAWPLPPHYDAYVGMDLGSKDLTGVVFGYYDFRGGKIIIQDEILMDFQSPDNTILTLTDKIKDKEKELWTNTYTNEVKSPKRRVSDINYIVTDEIRKISKGLVQFEATKKDDKATAINNLRILLSNKKIIIDPKCKHLLHQLRNVKWSSKTNKETFARSAESGHYDLVDALLYMVRSMDLTNNPYPHTYDYNMQDLYIKDRQRFEQGSSLDTYKKIFNVKPKRTY